MIIHFYIRNIETDTVINVIPYIYRRDAEHAAASYNRYQNATYEVIEREFKKTVL
jgi:hypothetical protein